MSVYDTREIGKVKIVMLGGAGGGSSTLEGLADTDINNPSNGQVLVYDSTSGMWENGADPTPIATTSVAGKVKPDGTSITVANDGTIAAVDQTPIATTSVAGKVKPDGSTITVDSDGTIHGVDLTPIATTSVAGKVKPDGTTITVNANGVISSVDQTPIATTSTAGKVKPDGTTITVDSDGTIHGTTGNYNDLSNKPQINSVTLSGNKSLSDLGIASITDLATKANNSIIADTFSSAVEYYAGDIVIYDGALYKFRSYHSGNWSGNDVDPVTVESLLGSGGLPEDPLGVAHGGTGNSAGYIRVGALSGTTVGLYTTAEGDSNTATASYAHAEGYQNTLTGNYAHVEGNGNEASANYTHAEGQSTTASKANAHAEGYGTTASGTSSHAEGQNTTASGSYSHAEGYATTASNSWAHAEGGNTSAGGQYSHAEGTNTSASGYASHAGGGYTIAGYNYQTVIGKYNDNKSTTLFEVGNGTSSTAGNALEVYSNGNLVAGGTISDANGALSAVEANPSGSASTDLTKLKVGSSVYSIPKRMRKDRYSVTSGSWSNSADSNGYYYVTKTLSYSLNTDYAPNIYCAGSSDSAMPTDTNVSMFCLINKAELTAASSLKLYARVKPTTTVYFRVEGMEA